MEPKEFRLNRKSALLTYPNVKQTIPYEDFQETLAKICAIKYIIVGQERHPLTNELHYHVYVEF